MVDINVLSGGVPEGISTGEKLSHFTYFIKMKKAFVSAALAVSALVLSSCGAPLIGAAYTDITIPVVATTAGGASKVGTATSTSYLGLWAEGDASIAAAKKNGGITTVSSVDEHIKSILGLYTTYTTTVRGE